MAQHAALSPGVQPPIPPSSPRSHTPDPASATQAPHASGAASPNHHNHTYAPPAAAAAVFPQPPPPPPHLLGEGGGSFVDPGSTPITPPALNSPPQPPSAPKPEASTRSWFGFFLGYSAPENAQSADDKVGVLGATGGGSGSGSAAGGHLGGVETTAADAAADLRRYSSRGLEPTPEGGSATPPTVRTPIPPIPEPGHCMPCMPCSLHFKPSPQKLLQCTI